MIGTCSEGERHCFGRERRDLQLRRTAEGLGGSASCFFQACLLMNWSGRLVLTASIASSRRATVRWTSECRRLSLRSVLVSASGQVLLHLYAEVPLCFGYMGCVADIENDVMTRLEDGIDFMSKNEATALTTSCSSVRAPTVLRCAVCMPLRSGTRRSNRASQEEQ